MSPPSTYFEWSQLLEKYASGDDSVFIELEKGTYNLDSGTVYRFYNKVQEAYVERKKKWIDKFNRIFQIHLIKSENDLSIALQNAKGNLIPIAKFIKLNPFPENLRNTLNKDFAEFVTEVRNNLRKSLSEDNPRYEKMIIIINNFNLFDMSINNEISDDSSTNSASGEIQNKRRILF
jgi:hypothetical protein